MESGVKRALGRVAGVTGDAAAGASKGSTDVAPSAVQFRIH
jgi:hypothetical protein